MPALVAGIHDFLSCGKQDVDGRHKAGHDDGETVDVNRERTDAALVLFSGGQDSTVCLAWALARFARVETIRFAYGQRHAVALAVPPQILERSAALVPA